MRTFNYDDEEGVTEGRDIYVSDLKSCVLGPDGEPLRKSFRRKVGFDLSKRRDGDRRISKR